MAEAWHRFAVGSVLIVINLISRQIGAFDAFTFWLITIACICLMLWPIAEWYQSKWFFKRTLEIVK